jgi:hypothetical protein
VAKTLGWLALGIFVLVIAGIVVVSVLKALFGMAFYLVAVAVIVGIGYYGYQRAKRSLLRSGRLRLPRR